MIGELGMRRWLAWMLVRLAEKLWFSQYEEEIIIEQGHTEVARVSITGDYYGSDVSSIFNNLPKGYRLRWISDGEEQELYLGGNKRG